MLALEGVGAAYGMSPVLSEIRFDIGQREVVALLGRNGVGKTTLLRTIAGLHPARSGRITFCGEDITALAAHERARRGISLVPQGRGIFPQLTVEENLVVGLSALTGAGRAASARVPEHIFGLFPVLARLRRRKGGVLSGGEQQQLAIARALVAQPTLLLLDEPTEGIQPSIVQEIQQTLERVRRELGVAVLLVEQYLRFAWSLSDRYHVMQRGRVMRSGNTRDETPEQIAHLLSV